MVGSEGYFAASNEIFFVAFNVFHLRTFHTECISLFFTAGKITRAFHGLTIHKQGRKKSGEAFGHKFVEGELQNGEFEQHSVSLQKVAAAAAGFHSAFHVYNV